MCVTLCLCWYIYFDFKMVFIICWLDLFYLRALHCVLSWHRQLELGTMRKPDVSYFTRGFIYFKVVYLKTSITPVLSGLLWFVECLELRICEFVDWHDFYPYVNSSPKILSWILILLCFMILRLVLKGIITACL